MALQNLKTYFEGANISDVDTLLSNKCIVTEKISGSSFHVKREGSGFVYYKSGSKDKMNVIDRTIVRYYENAIRHFKSVSMDAMEDMPFDWKFGFEYLGDNKTIDVEYDVLPKSNLILTHIQVMQPSNPNKVRKVIRDTKILNKWAGLLEVAPPPVLFEGQLHSGQKDDIKRILGMSVLEFEKTFEDKDSPSFTRTVFGIFNENMKQSALMNDLSKDVSGFIVNFHDGKSLQSFKLEKFNKKPSEDRKPSDMYQITILDIVEHLTQFNIEDINLSEEETDKIFTVVQIPAEFPGGQQGWVRYLERTLNRDLPVENGAPAGKYSVVISFVVARDGSISDVKSENDPGYGTKDEAVRVITRGPKWKPAVQNGRNVIYRHRQAIVFMVSED